MQSRERIAFYKEKIPKIQMGIDFARMENKTHLLAFNFGQLFSSRLMCGLLMWRIGLDPHSTFAVAVKELMDHTDELIRLGVSNIFEELPIEKGAIISTLTEQPFKISIGSKLMENNERKIDCLIAQRLFGEAQSNHPLTLEAVDCKNELTRKTYSIYLEILDRIEFKKPFHDLACTSEALFAERKLDNYYINSLSEEGGGEDNKFVVDYRLGAILKMGAYEGKSIHLWKWL
jgi:hypothetical protein